MIWGCRTIFSPNFGMVGGDSTYILMPSDKPDAHSSDATFTTDLSRVFNKLQMPQIRLTLLRKILSGFLFSTWYTWGTLFENLRAFQINPCQIPTSP